MGADRAGFYSYQWLENLAGCSLRNAERIHPAWQLEEGDGLVLHPKLPPLPVIEQVPGSHFVAAMGPPPEQRPGDAPWVAASWLFLVEPLGAGRCRFISRYRCATSSDLFTRLTMGPVLVEPIGFAMDREMLRGVKLRAEASWRQPARRGVAALPGPRALPESDSAERGPLPSAPAR